MKKNLNKNKTIAAVSTAAGKGAIAIVRLSGERAEKIARKILCAEDKKIKYREMNRYALKTANIKDDVTAVFFKAPKSYTGEDAVEIYCHGNNGIADEIVSECIRLGASAAENGEFTKRAFLNNKIDLTQAEGIIDIINAESKAGINAAYGAIDGEIFKEIEELQKEVLSMSAEAGAAVDYPEEDLEEVTAQGLLERIKDAKRKLKKLIRSYDDGKKMKDGVKVAIAGEPNAGKSLLLNRLLGRDRAIVTDIEGTTRDTLEEKFEYRGIIFTLIDTAGLRSTENEIEKFGIERSYRAIDGADVVLSVFEPGKSSVINDNETAKIIKVLNKSDIYSGGNEEYDIKISAKTGENVEELKEIIFSLTCKDISANGAILTNARQLEAVKNAYGALERAEQSASGDSFDCMISDLSDAYRALGSVTGAFASDDVVNEIFSRFCVGK